MVPHARDISPPGWTWNARREEAARLRSEGKDWPTIAAAVGYSYGTVRRFALEPAFLQRVRELRAARADEALGRLSAEAIHAADTIIALASTGCRDDVVRLAAARDLLDRLGVTAETGRAAAVAVAVNVGVTHADANHPDIIAARALILGALPGQSGLVGDGPLPAGASAAGADPV